MLDSRTGCIVASSTTERKRPTALAWSPGPGPAYTFASSADMDITIWTVDPFKGWVRGEKVAPGSLRRVASCLAFSADGQWLFAGGPAGGCQRLLGAARGC